VWTEIVTGGVVVGLIGTIVRDQYLRIAKKVDKVGCEKEHEHVSDRLKRGEEKFDKVEEKMNNINTLLIRVDERVAALAKKNGV